MNKRGSIVLTILIAIAYFMFGILIMNLILDDITTTRDAAHLECTAPDTGGDKITCLIVDGTIPIFILVILSTSGGYITERFLR